MSTSQASLVESFTDVATPPVTKGPLIEHPTNITGNSESSKLLPGKHATAKAKKGKPSSTTPHQRHTVLRRTKQWYARRNENPFTAWANESLLVLCAGGLMIAIIIILTRYQHQPQPSWTLGINLNTIIALLATLLRNSMVMVVEEVIGQARWMWQRRPQPVKHLTYFDGASRGPWGSFMLSFQIPKLYALSSLVSRHSTSTILACAVTVLSLAVGSFTQQAIKPVPCQVSVAGVNASLPLADRQADLVYVRYGAHNFDIDASLKGSIVNALGGTTTNPTVLLEDCITGNCTFGDINQEVTHRTTGFCSKCLDTTRFVELKDELYFGEEGDEPIPLQGCATLPNNMSLGSIYDEMAPIFRMNTSSLQKANFRYDGLNWAASAYDAEMQHILHNNATVFSTDILLYTKEGCKATVNERNRPVFYCTQSIPGAKDDGPKDWNVLAATCVLYPCVKDMQATVQGGVLTEKIVRTEPMASKVDFGAALYENHVLPDLPCTIDGVYYDSRNISTMNGTASPDYNRTDGTHDTTYFNGNTINLPYQCAYEVPYVITVALHQFWEKLAPGTCAPVINGGDNGLYYPWARCSQADNMDSWWHSALFDNSNATFRGISQKMEAVAVAITDAFRLDPKTRSSRVRNDQESLIVGNNTLYGTVWQSTVCTSFDWPWLVYPAVLVILTAIALSLMIWITATDEQKAPVWKTSTLPLIYCGDLGSLRELEQIAEKETAMLERAVEDDKWQIVLRHKSSKDDSEAAHAGIVHLPLHQSSVDDADRQSGRSSLSLPSTTNTVV